MNVLKTEYWSKQYAFLNIGFELIIKIVLIIFSLDQYTFDLVLVTLMAVQDIKSFLQTRARYFMVGTTN